MEMELPGLLYAGMVFYAFLSSSDILKDKNCWLKVKKDGDYEKDLSHEW